MGIKENFTQAVKELTGIGKPPEYGGVPSSVEELKKAVDYNSVTREITLEPEISDSDYFGEGINGSIYTSAESEQSERFEPADTVNTADTVDRSAAIFGTNPHRSRFGAVKPPLADRSVSDRTVPDRFASDRFTNDRAYNGSPTQSPTQSPTPAQVAYAPESQDRELTVISRNTIIEGNIRSFADMSVDGDIQGNVETTKNIDLNGKILGNITCNNALMNCSQIQGNVRLKGSVCMKRDTLLMGDLMSTYAEVNGKVKGNLDVIGKADFKRDAVVFGDISASTITVEDGAIIQGYVSTTFLNKEDSMNLFPETVIIGE